MNDPSYGYRRTLTGATFDEAVERVTKALSDEGFGILTEIDVKATLKKKLDEDFRPYLILGACNPNLAHQALQKDGHIGLLLPCNAVVQELDDGTIDVSIADPMQLSQMSDVASLHSVTSAAADKLQRVMESI